MKWWAVDVTATPETSAEVARWLAAETGQAVEERPDGSLAAAVTDEAAARKLADDLMSRPGVSAVVKPLDDVDWSLKWREGLGPRTIGAIELRPTWVSPEAGGAGSLSLVLDPGMAFGSGEHGSTRAALLLMQRRNLTATTVFDLGSGSGILSLAAARLGAKLAVGVESDPEAVAVAEENAATNGVTAVHFVTGDARTILPLLGGCDLVVSNILRQPNVELLPLVRRALGRGGAAIFSGMQLEESDLFLPALDAAGFEAIDQTVDDGWWAVTAQPC